MKWAKVAFQQAIHPFRLSIRLGVKARRELERCPKKLEKFGPEPSKWVFTVKVNPDLSVARLKARLVAKGYVLMCGVD